MKNVFSEYPWAIVSQISKQIVSAISTEKIYMLSVVHQRQELNSIFVEDAQEEYLIEGLNLLVLTGETDKRAGDEIQDIIEHRLGIQIALTAFVLPLQQFNIWLKRENPFALKVYHQAKLCYDGGNTPLFIPNPYNEGADKLLFSEELEQKTNKAIEFLAGAELYIVRKKYELAAFHLHQAAEQLYTGIIRFTTGLSVQTHNLDKLYRYSKYLLPGLKGIFPRDSEPERKLFQSFQKAYLGARYSPEYAIGYAEVIRLGERVKKILVMCQNIQQRKFITA
jgi:HEPN domain-containing protein